MKKCYTCGQTKPLDEYYKTTRNKTGYMGNCKTCLLKQQMKYQKTAVGEKVRKRYLSTDKAKDSARKRAKRHRDKYPQRAKAHTAVSNAVYSGILPHIKTQVCRNCGDVAEHYHHANGYDDDNILNVIPLCKMCHYEEHR